jgi:hypothetical protein
MVVASVSPAESVTMTRTVAPGSGNQEMIGVVVRRSGGKAGLPFQNSQKAYSTMLPVLQLASAWIRLVETQVRFAGPVNITPFFRLK